MVENIWGLQPTLSKLDVMGSSPLEFLRRESQGPSVPTFTPRVPAGGSGTWTVVFSEVVCSGSLASLSLPIGYNTKSSSLSLVITNYPWALGDQEGL